MSNNGNKKISHWISPTHSINTYVMSAITNPDFSVCSNHTYYQYKNFLHNLGKWEETAGNQSNYIIDIKDFQ